VTEAWKDFLFCVGLLLLTIFLLWVSGRYAQGGV